MGVRKKPARVLLKILFFTFALGAVVFGAGKWIVENKNMAQANLSPVALPDSTEALRKLSEGAQRQAPEAAGAMKDQIATKALPVWNQMLGTGKEFWKERVQPLFGLLQDFLKKAAEKEMGKRVEEFRAKYALESKKLKQSVNDWFSRMISNIFSPIK